MASPEHQPAGGAGQAEAAAIMPLIEAGIGAQLDRVPDDVLVQVLFEVNCT